MQNPAQICSGRHVEDTSRKSESPSRKRRKTSNSYIDLTNHSPSPPPTWSRERTEAERLGVSRRRVSSQRRVSGDSRRLIAERSNTPRARRSPGTRRRTRDRNPTPQNESGQEPRAFQPPHLMNPRQIHPASLHPHHLHGAPQQVMFEMEQMPVSTPVSMAPYAIPVCAGPHLPVCTGAHHPVCSTAPTWSIPGCSVQLPSCNMQHIPACSLPQIPFHPSSIPPLFHHHHHPATSHIPPQHLAPPTHFNPSARGVHRSEEEVSGLIDQRSRFPLHPGTLHPHGATPFTASPPVMLQEPHVHPTPHDIYGPFHRHFARQRSGGRNSRLRSLPLPPPPYPGFLLHFLAMLGNPPMPYGRDFHEDATEVENYEALLNLAERLGEAKPKGLTKPEIEQLPAYRFNKENPHSDMDQTSCVVCMCDFENRQLLRVLPCSHEFHAKCVDKWLKTNRTCPICRADATEIASQSD
ncbi:E3 ubiquitin-protein ligase RNF38-like isoform X3 [Crassostrea angulata]|nr:E3 ubiquitin-protein ligase RNF38-like isoform X3 [Crassostrea angulata]XP_052705177.1 E3 ubiquitin-protein ligase RNF38-like isoform X3 [Crassostrea angulata]